jgi:hypothetical protein
MAGTSSSLVVKISADINDFLKQLDGMTKGVDKAAERVAALGEKLTIGLTLPLAAAATAMAKFAADSEDTSARFERTFGSAADSVKASIESMKKVVPETTDELEKLATQTDLMLQGMEVAPDKAVAMSQAMLKLAADMAAVTHIPISEALEKLDSGLAGRSRGLIEFGLGFTKLELQQEAYRQNLLHVGSALTEAGTAQASFNLIMQRAGLIQGEAARTADESRNSWQFLSRDLKELGVSIGTIILPAFVSIVDRAKDFVNWINNLSTGTKRFLVDLATFLGVVGPVVLGLTKITQALFAMQSALKLMSGASGLAGVFTAASNPIGQFILAVTALAAIVWGLSAAWDAASSSLTDFLGKRGLLPSSPTGFVGVLPGTSSFGLTSQGAYNQSRDYGVLNRDDALAAFALGPLSKPLSTKGGPSDIRTGTPFQQLSKDAALAQEAFTRAADYGTSVYPVMERINRYHAEALTFIKGGADAFSEESVKAQALADKLQLIRDAVALNNAAPGAALGVLKGISQRPVDAGLLGSQSAAQTYTDYYKGLATRQGASQFGTPYDAEAEAGLKSRALAGVDVGGTHIAGSVENDLEYRRKLLGLTDGFDAAGLASVQYAEAQRQAQEDTALAFETIKIKLGPFGSALDGLSAGMQSAVVQIYSSVIGFAQSLAATIGGSGKGASTGRGIGGLLGGVIGSIIPGVGTVVGAAVGGFIGTAAGGLIGGAFDHSTKSVNDNASAMDNLSKTVNAVTASISNIPQFFKIESYRYAAAPIPIPGVSPSNPPSAPAGVGGTTGPYNAPIGYGSSDIHVHGNVTIQAADAKSARDLYEMMKREALKDRGTNSVSAFAFQGGF